MENRKHKKKESVPLVSIITATYNAEKHLKKCIKSVIEQNYPNMEFIIIDGLSTDSTVDIIKTYDDRIDYWISEKDHGVYDALNKGVDIAKGEWLYFLGADDQLEGPDVLNYFFSEPHTTKFTYGNVRWGDSGKIYDGKFSRTKLFRFNICQQAIFYHRDLFKKLGKFDLRYPLYADWVFNIRAFSLEGTKPLYRNIIVANYGTDGLSSERQDENLNMDREKLFRECFGPTRLFYAKLGHFFETRVLKRGEKE